MKETAVEMEETVTGILNREVLSVASTFDLHGRISDLKERMEKMEDVES